MRGFFVGLVQSRSQVRSKQQRVDNTNPAHHQDPARLQHLGRQRNVRGLRAALHAAFVSQVVAVSCCQHGVRRSVVSCAGSHRRCHRPELRLHQRAMGNPDSRPDHLPDRSANQLLRREVRTGHGPADSRRRVWLPRFNRHVADLRVVHLYILRARGGDHGARAGTVLRHAVARRLSGQLAGCYPAGNARGHVVEPAAAMDATIVADPAVASFYSGVHQEPGCLSAVHDLFRKRRRGRAVKPAAVRRGGDSGLFAHRTDRRAGRFSTLPARENPRQPGRLVGRDTDFGTGLDHSRHAENGWRRLPRLSRVTARNPDRTCSRTDPDVSGRL